MFNSTHTLAGFAIARTGGEKWVRYATATAVIASNLPDIDSIAGFWGTASYLDHHRGITHSLIGVPILSLLLSAVMCIFSGNFLRTYAVALVAMATHPALDYLNPYGLRPFLPMNGTWYYGDALFIFDPYLDALLLFGLILGVRSPKLQRAGAVLSLVLGVAYIGVRIELHAAALSHVDSYFESGFSIKPEKWALMPQMWNPFRWDQIVAFKDRVVNNEISMKTAAPSPVVMRAAESPSAATLLRFSRFPVTRVERLSTGYSVTFFDFRFYNSATNTALGTTVVLDDSMRVVSDDLSFIHQLQ
jgi:inner membrane protein